MSTLNDWHNGRYPKDIFIMSSSRNYEFKLAQNELQATPFYECSCNKKVLTNVMNCNPPPL